MKVFHVVRILAAAAFAVSVGAEDDDTGAAAALWAAEHAGRPAAEISLAGVTVTPLMRAHGLHYYPSPGMGLGALIQLYVVNASADEKLGASFGEARINGAYPLNYVLTGDWAWHDTPNIWSRERRTLPPGAMAVWTVNSVRPTWGPDNQFKVVAEDWERDAVYRFTADIEQPARWISAVTFLGSEPQPDEAVIHVVNESVVPIALRGVRFWLPKTNDTFRSLYPGNVLEKGLCFPENRVVPAGEKGIFVVDTEPLPLTYTAVEILYEEPDGTRGKLWAHLRIKREQFDISGGWCGGTAADGMHLFLHETYLKQLKRLYINTAHVGEIAGFHDTIGTGGLYDRYPVKQFGHPNQAKYDSMPMSAHVHGYELLGEPQLPFSKGGQLPQEVFKVFQGYFTSHLPMTITLSDEGTFPYYAGLSDFPHYDAYRVCAPAADVWTEYDRWDGVRIGWAAPLEGIGEMCRVLREMSRPKPTAVWTQGPHDGWYEMDGRTLTSPTPDELRVQAYHALSSRVTSLYWFNLSIESQLKYRDTLESITRIGREIRMLEDFYLQGDAYRYERIETSEGRLDWDLASIVAPHGALLFALDLAYKPNLDMRTFEFSEPRKVAFDFDLPGFLRKPTDVFRIDANGITDVKFDATPRGVVIQDRLSKVGIYVVTRDKRLRVALEGRRMVLIAREDALSFDAANNNDDYAALKRLVSKVADTERQ